MSIRDQFDQLNHAYVGANEAGDAEALSRLFTEDAILLAPGNPPLRGRDAIREIHAREFEENEGGFKLIVETLDFQEQGDSGYAVGTWQSEDENGNWMDAFERQDDGSLLYSRVCWNNS